MEQAEVSIDLGYRPRFHQAWLHKNMRRFNVLPLHRRFGKTYFSIYEMIDKAFRNPLKNPQYAYLGVTYGAVKRIAWDYLKDAVRDIPGVGINESELRIDIPRERDGKSDRIRIMLLGAENPNTIRGLYLDGVIFDEYAQMDPEIWTAVVRPALSDRIGWAIFIFTPYGNNHAHELYRKGRQDASGDWFTALLKASETRIIAKNELDQARSFMSEEMYMQEYECDFSAALVGAYYKEEMGNLQRQGRLTRVPYDPHSSVFTGWDLGMDDSTSIWFIATAGKELHAIDYLEVTGKGLSWIVKELNSKPYVYAKHFLPHDIRVRELGTGVSRLETLTKLGLKNIDVVKKLGLADGISATRGLLPRLWMDAVNCAYGIEAIKSYERAFDSKEGVFKMKPKHNWASHGADAMRTFAVGFRGDMGQVKSSLDFHEKSESDYDILGW